MRWCRIPVRADELSLERQGLGMKLNVFPLQKFNAFGHRLFQAGRLLHGDSLLVIPIHAVRTGPRPERGPIDLSPSRVSRLSAGEGGARDEIACPGI